MRSFSFTALLAASTACSGEVQGPGDGQTSAACASLEVRLRVCGLDAYVDNPSFACEPADYDEADEECSLSCLLAMACENLSQYVCGDSASAFYDCYWQCMPMMTCTDGTEIREVMRCDGDLDCPDGSDEVGCPSFTCNDGEVILAELRCDFLRDCADHSDEQGCPGFTCADGSATIYPFMECDGDLDCADGSDEHEGCSPFTCDNGDVIREPRECDNYPNCTDGSDEHAGCWYNTMCPG